MAGTVRQTSQGLPDFDGDIVDSQGHFERLQQHDDSLMGVFDQAISITDGEIVRHLDG